MHMNDDRGLTASPKNDRERAESGAAGEESSGRPKVVPPETLPDVPPQKVPQPGPVPRLTTFPPA